MTGERRSAAFGRRGFLQLAGTSGLAAGLGRSTLATSPQSPRALQTPPAADRLDQGPFTIDQDQGWFTIRTTTPSQVPIRNVGLGLIGYTWEENGPALAVREGRSSLETEIARMASLPFVDLLYIRCDWRHVQQQPGRLNLAPVWNATLEAAAKAGLRVAFRVQLSNPETQPKVLALPDFLQGKVPVVPLRSPAPGRPTFVEPQYDHPAFVRAFHELNDLLAARFDGDPAIEFMDLMMYGFWGEGHTSDWPHPFADDRTAARTFLAMTTRQLESWKKTPLAVNTQPDISHVGNDAVRQLAIDAGCWLRSDSITLDEPIQIEQLSGRPPQLAVVMEDGYYRHYRTDRPNYSIDAAGLDVIEHQLLHVLDLGGNYWALWTEADNLRHYFDSHPAVLDTLRRRIGYRVRPSWVWQRKRGGAPELIVAFANDGAAGVPGTLRVAVETRDGKELAAGTLDPGHPHASRLRQASFKLPAGLEGTDVRLRGSIEIRGVSHPVRWATAQPLDEANALVVTLMKSDDPRWRKGV